MPRSLARQLVEFGRTIRLEHSLFALPFALGAAMLADPGAPCPDAASLALLVACMVTARTAAMGFNRVADAALDARNPRTAEWAIPAGRLRRGTALGLSIAAAVAFLLCAALFRPLRGNPWPAILAPAFLAILFLYSWAKRWTVLAHWILGACLGLAPVGAWIALRASLDALPVVLGAAVLFWTAGFDILYAVHDAAFDRREGLKSVPARLGVRGARLVAAASHVAALALLAAVLVVDAAGAQPVLGRASEAALVLIAVVLGYRHLSARLPGGTGGLSASAPPEGAPASTSAGTADPRAFFSWNAAVSMVWLAGVVTDILLGRVHA